MRKIKKPKTNENSNLVEEVKVKEFKSINPTKMYEIYIQSYGNIDIINQKITELNLNSDVFCEILLDYIRHHVTRSKYATFFDHLDLMDITNKRNIITYCKNSPLSFREIKSNFQGYILMYRPDLLLNTALFSLLKRKIEIYTEYLESLNETSTYTTSLPYCKQMFQVFMESNYSILRFCYQNRILVSYFKKCLAKIGKEDPIFYSEIMADISLKEQIKEETIENDVYEILNKIKKLGNDFSIIDFLSITNYSFDEIIQKADIILSLEDKKLLRTFVSSYKTIKPYNEIEIRKLLEEKIVFNIDNQVIEIPYDVKKEIIDYLNTENISISTSAFHDACIRYYRNTLFANFSK